MSRLLNKIPQFFYAPTDSISGGGNATGSPAVGSGGNNAGQPRVNQPTNKEDVIEFLGAEDEPEVLDISGEPRTRKTKEKDENTPETETETQTEGETEESDEDDELAELEKELEGPTDEQLELVTPVRRKEILAKYPNVFKDFPYLEKAYYRDQQFTELLPTIADAKVAVEKATTLDKFENEIMGGTTENILKAVKEENPKGFYKIVDDYLPTLARVDEKAYMHLLGNITKHTIVAMVQEGKNSGNEVLQNAAQILNQFVFGSSKFTPPTNLSKDGPEEEQQESAATKRQQEFLRGQFESTNADLNTRINNTLKNTIDAHIDPKKSMSDYVRKNATKDALETVGELIGKDTRFKALTDKLWEKAFENNFDKPSMDKIRSAFLSKAKTLLPAVIKKARNEALRGTGHRVKDDGEETTPNRGPIAAGRPHSQTPSGKVTNPKDIPHKMSTLDFLNS